MFYLNYLQNKNKKYKIFYEVSNPLSFKIIKFNNPTYTYSHF